MCSSDLGKIGSITGVNIGKGDLTGNSEGVRITNAENLEISNIVILKQCSKGVSLADVTNLQINNITVESAAARVLAFDMAQDMASGNCSNITINNLIGNVVKSTRSYSSIKVKTSPPLLHPKQCHICLSGEITNDGDFSLWNGHTALKFLPAFFIGI